MSKEKQNNGKENALDKLSKALEFEALNENEAGELTGGFSDTLSEEMEQDGLEVNFSKCHCTTKETV